MDLSVMYGFNSNEVCDELQTKKKPELPLRPSEVTSI